MSNERERLARAWAESVNPKMPNEYVCAARDHILATTPEPTMDEVEWDTEKHVLAGATLLTNNDKQVDVVMLAKDVNIIDYTTLGGEHGYEHCSYFTPNGKKYELREATDKPENPETLRTVEDYENAPEGTIVALPRFAPYVKKLGGAWSSMSGRNFSGEKLGGEIPRPVLRWGWGE